MTGTKLSSGDPARVLVVADDQAQAAAIVAHVGEALSGAHTTTPDRMLADAAGWTPDVVLLGLASLDDAVRHTLALRAAKSAGAGAAFMLLLCDAVDLATAARLCREGVCDDYVQQFPEAADPDRLAASLRIACHVALADRPRVSAPGRARARPIVLVVEDDTFSQQLIAITLETRGVDLVFETDGSTALERISAVQPDLVLMDVMLPGRDGVDLTQSLKADPALAGIPVVMLTGEARREVLVRSMEAGAADFIVKPFTPDALIAKLAKYLPHMH
ncbi:MAG: response regulator [Caldimonas sp.]